MLFNVLKVDAYFNMPTFFVNSFYHLTKKETP